ncbi:MAG: ACP phosphodiesterase [Paludibacter sp.]
MNYLAHIFLAGNDKYLQVGGFIADFVKGNKSKQLPDRLWKGIVIHRNIDTFTDTHPLVRELVEFLRPEFGRYSGIVLDMYFDYLLASNFSKYSKNISLFAFSVRFSFYSILLHNYLPKRVKGFIFHFISSNRLYKYSTIDGLKNSLEIMSNYKVKALNPEHCIRFLIQNITQIEPKFTVFFDELQAYVVDTQLKSKL